MRVLEKMPWLHMLQSETQLARSAAVNFVDGDANVPIRSRNAHYVTRHQICGKNVPWYMTNTSEPHADDMLVQQRILCLLTGWSKECVDYRMFPR